MDGDDIALRQGNKETIKIPDKRKALFLAFF
jgi:hypothetical protein